MRARASPDDFETRFGLGQYRHAAARHRESQQRWQTLPGRRQYSSGSERHHIVIAVVKFETGSRPIGFGALAEALCHR